MYTKCYVILTYQQVNNNTIEGNAWLIKAYNYAIFKSSDRCDRCSQAGLPEASLDVVGFDDGYGCGYEDVNLCLKLTKDS